MPGKADNNNKIIWFLVGNPKFVASSRIHGLNVHNKLVALGYCSVMSYLPAYIEEEIPLTADKYSKFEKIVNPGDIVILQKVKSGINLPLVHRFKQSGLKIILIDCDLPISPETGRLADVIICTSRNLCSAYRKHGLTAHYIEDSPEFYIDRPGRQTKDKLQCLWFGHGSKKRWQDVMHLKSMIQDDPRLGKWELITISNHHKADIQWHPDFFQDLIEADAVVVPVFGITESCNSKSGNRALQAMALSVPVICSPISSYLDIVSSGVDGFICSNDEEWKQALLQLESPIARYAIGKAGYMTAKKFELSNVIHEWIRILKLDDKFKIEDSLAAERLAKKIQRIFFMNLLKKNTKYWSMGDFTLYNGFYFMYTKLLRARNKALLNYRGKPEEGLI